MEGWALCRGCEGGVGGGQGPGTGRSAAVGACGVARCGRTVAAGRHWCEGRSRCGYQRWVLGARRRGGGAEAACRPVAASRGPLALPLHVLLLLQLLAALQLAARKHFREWQVQAVLRWALLRASGNHAAGRGHLTPSGRRGRLGQELRRLHQHRRARWAPMAAGTGAAPPAPSASLPTCPGGRPRHRAALMR